MTDDPTAPDPGGDPVCWLHHLCPVCRAVPTADSPSRCWRCGEPLASGVPSADPDDERSD